jgi:hypothetical protein
MPVNKTHIIIHHSASADHPTHVNFQAIRDYHVNINKWRDVGYNFVIDRINGRPEVFVGRMLTEDGAHTVELSLNKVGVGICLVGNFDQDQPSSDSLELMARLCKSMMEQFCIPPENVLGHWEAQAMGGVPIAKRKTCPGLKFSMDEFRKRLKS